MYWPDREKMKLQLHFDFFYKRNSKADSYGPTSCPPVSPPLTYPFLVLIWASRVGWTFDQTKPLHQTLTLQVACTSHSLFLCAITCGPPHLPFWNGLIAVAFDQTKPFMDILLLFFGPYSCWLYYLQTLKDKEATDKSEGRKKKKEKKKNKLQCFLSHCFSTYL